MANKRRLVDTTRRRIVLGGPALVGFASSGVLTACSGGSTTKNAPAAAGSAEVPAFSPAGGSYPSAQTVSLTTQTANATIYYTVDGTTPTTTGGGTTYVSPIAVSTSKKLQAIAAAPGLQSSPVASAVYTIDPSVAQVPTFSPAGGTYTSAQTVSLSTQTSGAKIYYTTDGTTPTTSSTEYASPITISGSETVQAIATAAGYNQSAVGQAQYVISIGAGYDGVIAISGNHFVNGSGVTLQLRGTNMVLTYAGMITASRTIGSTGVPDCTGADWGGNDQSAQTTGSGAATKIIPGKSGPDTTFMANWKFNCIRVCLNEASILGYTVYDFNATPRAINPDNYGAHPNLSYMAQIAALVAGYNAIGCYVILNMYATNPGLGPPIGQDSMTNQDHTIQAWTAVANAFGYPNGTFLKRNGGIVDDQSIIFETFNEPQMFSGAGPGNATNTESIANWQQLMNGGFKQAGITWNNYGFPGFGSPSGGHWFSVPVNTPSGGSGAPLYFTPGEAFTASNGTAGYINAYYVNTTTGYDSSGTKFLHIYNLSGTNISNGVPTVGVPMPPGTTITGASSRATCTIQSSAYPGQSAPGQYGWYQSGQNQLVAAIRAARAWNPCIIPGTEFEHDLSFWATYAAADTTPPTDYNGGGWTPQVAAGWHPYPGPGAIAYISAIAVASRGSGYAVNDTILLEMPQSGPYANTCWNQCQLKVTNVSGGAVTGVSINAYIGGVPGVANTPNNNFSHVNGNVGGIWCLTGKNGLPPNPLTQYRSSGSGTGATFNATFTTYSSTSPLGWADPGLWLSVAQAIIQGRGAPVVITETGDHYGVGLSAAAPWAQFMTQWCDTYGAGFIAEGYAPNNGWSNVSTGGDWNMVYTVGGTRPPTPGFGTFMYNWYTTHAP